ncbi:3-deoxy-7-phosphoheptulonate synthase [Streptomyces sp. NPDC046465]|uniref:3-deoxy-7-phosphoheptulonate synthase n=1 Tax=Streptomyces sp. NPDC046465 TaxID=3155810 RepID=UPI0033CF6E5E
MAHLTPLSARTRHAPFDDSPLDGRILEALTAPAPLTAPTSLTPLTSLVPLDALDAAEPEHPNAAHSVRENSRTAVPLVHPAETERLKVRLAAVARGEAFLIQGGDSTGLGGGAVLEQLTANLRALHQVSLVLMYATGLPVVKLAQVCGPYARSGGAVGEAPGDDDTSAAAMNLFRGLCHGETADLRRVHGWNADFVRTAPAGRHHRTLHDTIGRALRFMASSGFTDRTAHATEVYTSRRMPAPVYSGSAHFLWADRADRADQLTAFAGGSAGPFGLRVGPGTDPARTADLVEQLDPHADPGRLTLSVAMGSERIREALPPVVERVAATGRQVVWQCDPLSANTPVAANTPAGLGVDFDAALDEVTGFFGTHHRLGTHAGGIRIETAGARRAVDGPRLTPDRAVELAFRTAELLRGRGEGRG